MKWYSPDMLVPVTPISVVSNFTCLGLKRKSKDSEKIGLAEQGHAMGQARQRGGSYLRCCSIAYLMFTLF